MDANVLLGGVPKVSRPDETSNEETRGSEKDESLAGVGSELVVLGKTAELVEPAEGAFDDPASREDRKPFLRVTAPDDLQTRGGEAKASHHPAFEFRAGVTRVGPDEFKFGEGLVDLIEHQRRAVTVLQAGRMNAHLKDQAVGIHQQMAFASHDLLSRIIAAHSSSASRAHALAIQDRGRRGFFLPLCSRAASRKAAWSFSKSPCSRHFAK